MQDFFVGVDGGGTKSTIRVEDTKGNLLGQEQSGPANIRLSVDVAWQSINNALEKILKQHAIPFNNTHRFHIGMGLAGCELVEAQNAFLSYKHNFKTLLMSSDAHIACLGAHKAQNGAIIIVGTGIVGYQVQDNHVTKVGGWGFPNDDEGSGAWLGLEAVRVALKWRDGRSPESALARAVFNHFEQDLNRLVSWSNQANSSAFATLAPYVIECSQRGDSVALQLLKKAAEAVDQIAYALFAGQKNPHTILPCALIGGITQFLKPYLNTDLQARLVVSQLEPSAGAILLIKNHMQKRGEL